MMDEPSVRSLVDTLDAAVPASGAVLRLVDYDVYESRSAWGFVGNRCGYLRFGITMLRLGLSPDPDSEVLRGRFDLGPLLGEDSTISVTEFVRSEDPTVLRQPRFVPLSRTRLALRVLAATLLVALLLVCLVLGAKQALGWVF